MSRTKSAEKRAVILKSAQYLFLKLGYQRVSMDKISQHAGVSKNTLYSHFKNKAVLFADVLKHHWDKSRIPLINESDARPLSVTLTEFAQAFMKYLYRPNTMALFRTLVAESGQFPGLTQSILQENEPPIKLNLMHYLQNKIDLKQLRPCCVSSAANQFYGLLKEDAFWHVLLGFRSPYSPKEIETLIDDAVKVFLDVYQI